MATVDKRCRCDEPQPHRIRSRHSTSEGELVWGECTCGVLHAWLYRAGQPTGGLVAQGPSQPAGVTSIVPVLAEKQRNIG